MNWGFTSEGVYDLTFRASTTLSDGTFTQSDPFTMRFGINATTVVPEPGRSLLLLTGCAVVLLRRRRRCRTHSIRSASGASASLSPSYSPCRSCQPNSP